MKPLAKTAAVAPSVCVCVCVCGCSLAVINQYGCAI